MAAPASGAVVQLCPSAPGGGAVAFGAATTIPAGACGPPSVLAAVPGSSGRQQCWETSRPSRRRRRSSSDGTDRRSKKRPRGRSPSPGPSSRRRERSYRSDSALSEDDRAETSPPRAGRAPGGTPGDFRSAPAGDRSLRPGSSGWTSRSSARADHHRSGAGRRSHSPSGGADDDRSSAVDTVDFDQDDSFRSVLGLIRSFHAMEEPAGTPSAQCKTSPASIYGLMSETSPAFHLPVSPLVRSLLDDTMETVASVLLSVREGDFLASLDLKDAYFQIPIHGSSRKLLRFMSEGTVYQFKALCFGLSTAPQVFTRVFAAVSAWAHSRGIRLLRYLDDWLVLSSSEKKAKESIRELLSLCRTLGIVINEKKSDLVPSQSAKYLGMTIDTGAGKVFPSLARVEKFLTVAERFCSMQSPPAQLWQVILGHLASLERLVPHGRLRMRSLQWHLKSQWSPESDPPSLPVALPEEARRDLSWWMVRDHLLVGVRFGTPAPDLHLYSDASSSGWGAHLLDQNVSGVWSAQEKLLHINLLEMKALFLGLQAFQEDVAGHHVTAMCDNSTVVAYVNKQGGTVSRGLCVC